MLLEEKIELLSVPFIEEIERLKNEIVNREREMMLKPQSLSYSLR